MTKHTLLALLLAITPAFAAAAAEEISREAFKKRQANGAQLVVVDVRSPEEFAAGHIPGAINIPHDRIATRAGELAANKSDGNLVLYCRSGRRVAMAVEILEKQGFSKLLHLEGDMPGWVAAGEPAATCTTC
jgi:phage shock protein E